MKILVIGGTGLIGSRLVINLRAHGHEAVAASPKSGVNSVTGDGLADALKGASVVIDVTNSPPWEDSEVLKFFETSTRNLLAFEAAEGVGHQSPCPSLERNASSKLASSAQNSHKRT